MKQSFLIFRLFFWQDCRNAIPYGERFIKPYPIPPPMGEEFIQHLKALPPFLSEKQSATADEGGKQNLLQELIPQQDTLYRPASVDTCGFQYPTQFPTNALLLA